MQRCHTYTPTKLQSQNIFKESTREHWGGGGGEGQDGCERRIKVFVKIEKKKIWGGGGGVRLGGGGGGVRVDVNREVKFL